MRSKLCDLGTKRALGSDASVDGARSLKRMEGGAQAVLTSAEMKTPKPGT